jgi:hypothetical protein
MKLSAVRAGVPAALTLCARPNVKLTRLGKSGNGGPSINSPLTPTHKPPDGFFGGNDQTRSHSRSIRAISSMKILRGKR